MKKFLLIMVITMLFFISCAQVEEPADDDDIPDIEGIDSLGMGYDIFDTYADRTKVKGAILNISAINKAGLLNNSKIENSHYKSISGTDISTYSSSLMQSCNISGGYRGFSGAIRESFSQSRYSSTEYSFATVNIYVHKYGLYITDRNIADSLKPYLNTTFRNRLNDADFNIQTLFQTYGTHCMTGVIVGARLDYNVSAKTSDISGSKSISVYAEASYRNLLMNASVSGSGVTDTEFSTYKSSEEKKLKAYGGSSEYAVSIATKGDYDAWLETINDNPVFCDYYENSLMPIWEFCDDATRKAAIEDAFLTWADDRQINISATPKNAIIGLIIVTSDLGDYSDIEGVRYYKINQDLNEGAGGDYIYIYAAVGLDNSTTNPPITGLILHDTEDTSVSDASYTKISTDLNKGADGDYIYLYYTTDPTKGNPIRAMNVYNYNDNTRVYSYGASSSQIYSSVLNTKGATQDLNEGSGGDYIYLEYSRNYID